MTETTFRQKMQRTAFDLAIQLERCGALEGHSRWPDILTTALINSYHEGWKDVTEGVPKEAEVKKTNTLETRYEMLLDVAQVMAKALEHYRAVVAEVNNPDDWTPQISDEGSHARCALMQWRAFYDQHA